MATQTEALVLPSIPQPALESGSDTQSPSTDSVSQCSDSEHVRPASRFRKAAVTFQLSGVNFASSAANSIIVVGLPRITEDLNLPQSLAFWPSSVPGLATASTLLLAGAVADVLGPRSVDLLGCTANGAFMLACAFIKKGEELVVLRALQGVALALHLSSSVSLVTKILPRGRGRNLAFACLGLSQPLGFSFGLVIGGILVDTIGWRSACIISTDVYHIKEPGTIVILCLGVLALPLFIGWMHRQHNSDLPVLIPNSFWDNSAFVSICATIALSFGVLTSLELFASLFFQEIQHLSALQTAIRILPSMVVGVILNFSTGLFVHKVPALWLVVVTSLLSAGSPLLMATIQPSWSYWASAFFAQLFMPFSVDVLFTVGLIIITNIFPEDKQSVAGAVFNTAAQFGNAFGLAVMQVVSSLVSKDHGGIKPSEVLMKGYRASFWTMFAFMMACVIIAGAGLRKIGKIGLKQD
uniref:Major facilitator superfamily (MFS) profile domain-containing protein n=1 Tax=Fusarium oxysporum (strain Fo5176) TaxID=660025 RepID=A0A0D2XNW8_FUSOF